MNLQSNIMYLVYENGNVVAQYAYDPYGKVTNVVNANNQSITSPSHIGNLNPLRYRGYCYDNETGLYYLISRYYDPITGRFINADDPAYLGFTGTLPSYNLYTYCENNMVNMIDSNGLWAEKYSGFKWTSRGFNLNVQLDFLSRAFCLSYAADIIKLKGKWYWWGKGYKNMDALRIAQELWFHALVYYVGSPIKSILNKVGVSWNWLNSYINSAKYMEINNNDDRAWVFSIVWFSAYTIRTLIRKRLGAGFPFSYIHL